MQIFVDKRFKKCILRLNVLFDNFFESWKMAKAVKLKIKLESSAGTGTFYMAEKNPRTHPEKLVLKKFDKKSRKHEEFVEKKLK